MFVGFFFFFSPSNLASNTRVKSTDSYRGRGSLQLGSFAMFPGGATCRWRYVRGYSHLTAIWDPGTSAVTKLGFPLSMPVLLVAQQREEQPEERG